VKPSTGCDGVRPAPLIDRAAARAVDLFLMGAVSASLSLLVVLFVRIGHSMVAFGPGPNEVPLAERT